MNRYFFVIVIISVLAMRAYAQFDQDLFFIRVNSIYHTLESTEIKNFTLSVTSDYFELSTNEFIDNENYFPVEFIWLSPNKMYFIKNALPADLDTAKQKRVYELQKDLQQGLKGIFIDWQRFVGGKILDNLPQDYQISNIGDTVHIEFEALENNIPVHMKFYFGINALCFKIETTYKNSDQKMITYPAFVLIDNKWLCTKWTVKIIQAGEIQSGFVVALKSQSLKEKWFPLQALISVQTKEKLNETFQRLYKFRNLELNREIKILKN